MAVRNNKKKEEEKEKGGSRQKILVAVDHSEHAKRAFLTAIWLAKSLDARLVVIHVVPSPPPLPEDLTPVGSLAAIEKSYLKVGSKLLADYAWEAQIKHAMKVETVLETGDAREKILEAAKDARLVILGSRGMSRVKGVIVGSVSQAVVQKSKTPVIVVK